MSSSRRMILSGRGTVRVLSLLLAALVLALSGCQRDGQELGAGGFTVAEGKSAPDIAVRALNGADLRLSQLKGRVVLLNFWATWCPPCREEIPSMMRLNAAMADRPFQMVAISLDEGGRTAIESFFRANGYLLPAYTDVEGRAADAFGVTGVPETFLIDKQGIVVRKIIGPLVWDAPEVISYVEDLMRK